MSPEDSSQFDSLSEKLVRVSASAGANSALLLAARYLRTFGHRRASNLLLRELERIREEAVKESLRGM